MKNTTFVLFDTETTGPLTASEAEKKVKKFNEACAKLGLPPQGMEEACGQSYLDRIIQLAFIEAESDGGASRSIALSEDINSLPKGEGGEKISISIGAIETHHIHPQDLEGKQAFSETPTTKAFMEYVERARNGENIVFVAHNAQFDVQMLKTEGIDISDLKIIDTFRIFKALYPGLDSYREQHLRIVYDIESQEEEAVEDMKKELNLDSDFKIAAHDALGDIVVLKLLLDKLLSDGVSIEKMLEITTSPILVDKMPFGQFKGFRIAYLAGNPVGAAHLAYMASLDDMDPDLLFTIKQYEDKILSNMAFGFGKHKGKSVKDVAVFDNKYLKWYLSTETKDSPIDPLLKKAILSALEAQGVDIDDYKQ